MPIKKVAMSGAITLFFCVAAYATDKKIDIETWEPSESMSMSIDTSTSDCNTTTSTDTNTSDCSMTTSIDTSTRESITTTSNETHTYETRFIPDDGYDTFVQHITDKVTGDSEHYETYMHHDDPTYVGPTWNPEFGTYNEPERNSGTGLALPDQHDFNSSDNSTRISQDQDDLKDSTLDHRRQEIADNEAKRNGYSDLSDRQISKLQRLAEEYARQASGCRAYYPAISPKTVSADVHVGKDIVDALNIPVVRERLQHFKEWSQEYETQKGIGKKNFEFVIKENKFIDALLSGQVSLLLDQIQYANLTVAQSAFEELKSLWPWYRQEPFLVPLYLDNRENTFTVYRLGVDVIKIAQKDLFIRKDYIAHYADEQSSKIIQNYKEKCILLQQKGDIVALRNESKQLCNLIVIGVKKNDFVINACLAVVEDCCLDPINKVFSVIKNAPSLEKAHAALKHFESQVLSQIQQQNITLVDQVKELVVNQYGYDVLDAAQDLYKSRADYIATPENQSIRSDGLAVIVNNIAFQDLPTAHEELVHLKTQVAEALQEHNITDPVEQKECIINNFGVDVLDVAQKKYQGRLDHIDLVKKFIPFDVQGSTIEILGRNNTCVGVANEMTDLADNVFANARLCTLPFVANIEPHIYDSIDAMMAAKDCPTFIFNLAAVNHVLDDVQLQSQAIVTGQPVLLGRSSELFIRGITKFAAALNPITQAKNMGGFVYDAGSFVVDSFLHPVVTSQKVLTITAKVCDHLIREANFTIDTTIGRHYLSQVEYRQRIDDYMAAIDNMPPSCLAELTVENWVDLTAQIAADFVFFKGLGGAYAYLKEIDAMSKLNRQVGAVGRALKKGVDTHLADNPILITAEGIQIKLSNAMHNLGGPGKEIITSSKALLESAYAKIAIELETEIKKIREFYNIHPKYDFLNFGKKPIKIAYEHILGMELKWGELGNLLDLKGFHHDFMGAVENSKVFKFLNKIVKENGCYKADIFIDGICFEGKTFFPKHWTQEEVISKIHEAYANFIKSGAALELERDGKYVVKGLTNEGITIKMHITQNGFIKTAYPIVK